MGRKGEGTFLGGLFWWGGKAESGGYEGEEEGVWFLSFGFL